MVAAAGMAMVAAGLVAAAARLQQQRRLCGVCGRGIRSTVKECTSFIKCSTGDGGRCRLGVGD